MAVKFPRAVGTSTDLGTSEMSRARREATTRHDFGQQVFGWWEVGGVVGYSWWAAWSEMCVQACDSAACMVGA